MIKSRKALLSMFDELYYSHDLKQVDRDNPNEL